MPATELELKAQLAAAQATIDALRAQQEKLQKEPGLATDDMATRNALYRRMDASLWEKHLLQEYLGPTEFEPFSRSPGSNCLV